MHFPNRVILLNTPSRANKFLSPSLFSISLLERVSDAVLGCELPNDLSYSQNDLSY